MEIMKSHNLVLESGGMDARLARSTERGA